MSTPTIEQRRAELEGWIAKTRSNQRKLGIGLAVGAVIAIGLMFWSGAVGGVALGTVLFVGLCGFWITIGHIMDWNTKIRDLGKPKVLRVSGGGRRF